MIEILGIASTLTLVAVVWYKVGYERRESQFQNNPVIFQLNGKNVIWVGRESGVIKIKIYDNDLVEVLKK